MGQIHKVSDGTSLFYKQEIACHSLLLHYKGEGFTCDLSAREPLVCSWMENLERSPALHAGVRNSSRFSEFWSLCQSSFMSLNPHTAKLNPCLFITTPELPYSI